MLNQFSKLDLPAATQSVFSKNGFKSYDPIYNWRRGEISSVSEARILIAEAEQVIAAQRHRIAQLENLALTDELTGVVNRRGLMLELGRELAAAARDDHARGLLILCDLNAFKQVNDLHGHNAGDAYLKEVAAALTAEVRSSDLVSRIGGDEFAIIMTRTDSDNGLARLRKLEHGFHTRALTWGARVLPLKASFGAAPFNANDTPEGLFAAADLRLYAQKAKLRV
ncbi:MAG: GGDEF domain-containing protein [Alphaproteobacteria bacterium]